MLPCPVVHIVGARPQFVKAAVVLSANGGRWRDVLVHTGQHYDPQLSDVFFRELRIPQPDVNLEVGSGSHGVQTGAMMAAIEETLSGLTRGVVVVYGDTNSTLAGAVVAAKSGWPVVHVEAGLRSFDRSMPEEVNRIAVDHISDLLLCPTQRAVDQLHKEGLEGRSVFTGDVMLDVALKNRERACRDASFGRLLSGADDLHALDGLGGATAEVLGRGQYTLATIHRAANTDDPARLKGLIETLCGLERPVILPLHPRTRGAMDKAGLVSKGALHCIDPVGYLDFAALVAHAAHVVTDSGGVQKEAIFHGRHCTTLRDTTEWPETLEDGWNVLVDVDADQLRAAIDRPRPESAPPVQAFGGGRAAEAVCDAIAGLLARDSRLTTLN